MGDLEHQRYLINEAIDAVEKSDRLQLAAQQLAILATHNFEPTVIDAAFLARPVEERRVEVQRVLSLKQRVDDELANEQQFEASGHRYEPKILTPKEQEALPAAIILVGLIDIESEDKSHFKVAHATRRLRTRGRRG